MCKPIHYISYVLLVYGKSPPMSTYTAGYTAACMNAHAKFHGFFEGPDSLSARATTRVRKIPACDARCNVSLSLSSQPKAMQASPRPETCTHSAITRCERHVSNVSSNVPSDHGGSYDLYTTYMYTFHTTRVQKPSPYLEAARISRHPIT